MTGLAGFPLPGQVVPAANDREDAAPPEPVVVHRINGMMRIDPTMARETVKLRAMRDWFIESSSFFWTPIVGLIEECRWRTFPYPEARIFLKVGRRIAGASGL